MKSLKIEVPKNVKIEEADEAYGIGQGVCRRCGYVGECMKRPGGWQCPSCKVWHVQDSETFFGRQVVIRLP